jgi:hypothetical protein
MTQPAARRTARLVALVLGCISLPAFAQAPAPGVKWKITMSMAMQGMTMPPRTHEVCAPANSTEAPINTDGNCQILDRKRVGNTESFRMVCGGPNGMEGRMEITHDGPNRYRGRMVTRTDEGEMTMNYAGEKLGGACDANEMQRKANEAIERLKKLQPKQ